MLIVLLQAAEANLQIILAFGRPRRGSKLRVWYRFAFFKESSDSSRISKKPKWS